MDVKWPDLSAVETEELASVVLEICKELSSRKIVPKQMALEAANKIWPTLHKALRESGKEVGLSDNAEPRLVEFAEEPMVALSEYYGNKPRNKREAMIIAQHKGTGWATIGDLWLWVGGGGPIVEKMLKELGYGPKA